MATRSAGANHAISSASRCVASASAQTIATSCCDAAACVACWANAKASAEPARDDATTLRPAPGSAGSRRGSTVVDATGDGKEVDNGEDNASEASKIVIIRGPDRGSAAMARTVLPMRSRNHDCAHNVESSVTLLSACRVRPYWWLCRV